MIEKLLWKTEKRKVSELKDHKSNPRTLSKKSHDELLKSFNEFDYVELVAINSDNTILAGHQRVHIMHELGWNEKEIEVRIPSRKLNDKEAKKYLLRSNKNVGEWDFDILANDFEIDELLDVGFTEDELIGNLELEEEASTEENEIKEETETNIKIGDVIHLNDHILYCGDAESFIYDASEKALIFTDPPYELEAKKVISIIKKTAVKHIVMITTFKQGADIYSSNEFHFHFDFVIDAKVPKSFMNRKQPYYTHQNGLYFSLNNDTIFNCDNAKGKRSGDTSENGYWHTIITSPRNTQANHGHSKNMQGMLDVLSGFKFDEIIDPFCGGGTSLMCAVMLRKKFMGCELSPVNCQNTINRFKDYMEKNNKDYVILKNGVPME